MGRPVEDVTMLQGLLVEARLAILEEESRDQPDRDELHALRGAAQMIYIRLHLARHGLPPLDDAE